LKRLKDGETDDALSDLDRALAIQPGVKVDPAFSQAYGARGQARLKKGDADGGLEDLGKAILLNPGEASWRIARAKARLAGASPLGAAEDVEALVAGSAAVPPELTAIFIRRASSRLEQGD